MLPILPCEVTYNDDGSINFLNMTPEFVEHLLGYAVTGASDEHDDFEIGKYIVLEEALYGPHPCPEFRLQD